MSATYFLAYRYEHGGDVIDGNTVMELERPPEDHDDIRDIEDMIAGDVGVSADVLGLINLVRLK
jgi:hypothetical protein